MSKNNTCKETFLDNIVSVSVYNQSQCNIPVPYNVPFVKSVKATFVGEPLLKVAYNDDADTRAKDATITAKYSSDITPSGRMYIMDINATIEQGFEDVEVAVNTSHADCIALLEKVDGTQLLVHTIPNTFKISSPSTITNEHTMSLSIIAKAVSPYIQLQI